MRDTEKSKSARFQEGKRPGQERQATERLLDRMLDRIRELEQTQRQHAILRKLSGYLKASLTQADAYAAIECFAAQLFESTAGKLYLAHPPGKYMETVATWGDKHQSEQAFTIQDCWALRRAQPHCVRDPQADLLCGHVTPTVKSELRYLCVPVFAQGETIGLLHLQRVKKESEAPESGSLTESGVNLAITVAEEVGLALANLKLRETLREQSIRDSLTGLYNRRFLEEFLMRELARAERKKHALSIITLDIDHFKRINDTSGHGAGDMVLRRIGLLLQGYVRESDIACRVGGEEFALLLPEVPMQIAAMRAEDIRRAVHEMTLKHDDQNLSAITVSLGVAAFPEHGTTPEALIRAADQALYDAKGAGRDKVVSA